MPTDPIRRAAEAVFLDVSLKWGANWGDDPVEYVASILRRELGEPADVPHSETPQWSDDERSALIGLAQRQELTQAQVLRQALRLYQAVVVRKGRVVFDDELPKYQPMPLPAPGQHGTHERGE